MQDQEQSKSNDKFRVDADVENNQLILWANPVEMEEVHKLLAKLGEVVVPGANTSTVRVLNLQPGEDTAAALERLRRMWPMLAPNPLLMPTAPNSNQQESTPAAPQERQIPHNEEARAADPIQRSSLPAKAPPVAASEPKTAASQRVVAGDGDNRPAPTPIAVPAVLHKASREESESTTTPIEPRSLPKADGNSGPTVLNRNDPDGRSANAPGVSRGAKVGSGNRQAATQEPPPLRDLRAENVAAVLDHHHRHEADRGDRDHVRRGAGDVLHGAEGDARHRGHSGARTGRATTGNEGICSGPGAAFCGGG